MVKRENHPEFLKELRDSAGEIWVFQHKVAFINFSILSSGPHIYIPASQAHHLLQLSSLILTPSSVLHSIFALNQPSVHFLAKMFTKNSGGK